MEANFTLGVGLLFSIYWVRKATTASKSFSYLSGWAFTTTTVMDNLSHLMLFNRYQTFDNGSRHWYPYSIRFPRINMSGNIFFPVPCFLYSIIC